MLNILFFLMKISCWFDSPYLSSQILRISLRNIKKIKKHKITKSTFLVLHKEGGIDDLICAYENKNSKINYLILNRRLIKIIYNQFLKNKLYDYDYNYFDWEIVQNKKKYFDYLDKVIFFLKKSKNFKGIINFNIFYYAEVELQKVCKKQRIKFFTIHKESLHPPIYRKYLKWIYTNTSNNFYGDKIFLYNNFEKKLLIESRICKSNQVEVIGMPRLSQSFKIKKQDKDNNKYKNSLIVYQSNEKYLPYFKNKHFKKPDHTLFDRKLPFSLENTEIECVKILKKIAKKKNIKISIKTRTGQKQSKFIKAYKGLNILSGGAGHRHLKPNQIVVAFNSTIIFEALAAGKVVFTPNFIKNYKKNSSYFFNYYNTTLEDKNKISFKKNIIKMIDNENYRKKYQNNKKINRLLKIYLNNSDNRSGERLVKSLEKFA